MASTKAILTKLYPKVAKALEGKDMRKKYIQCIGRFLNSREESLYAVAPFDRIYFGQADIDDFFKTIGIEESTVVDALKDTYYYSKSNFNPAAAKDPFTVAMMCVIRYYFLEKDEKALELSMTYLAFSGKFYPSIHYSSFPKVVPRQYEHVMLYVVNNMLSQKFELKSEGSLIGAVRSIAKTWINTYDDRMKSFDDEDVVYMIQQLHNRIKSMIQNIAELYYDAYNNKDVYLTYDGDNMSEDDYHLADSDSLKAQRVVEASMNKLNTSSIDYKICKRSSDSNVKTDEIKSIMESILSDNANQPEIKELVNLIVIDYYKNSKKKDVRDIEFISYTISPKPNAKDPNLLREKEIIEGWLDENSPQYRKRKSRAATKTSYYKAVLYYFTLSIYEANI